MKAAVLVGREQVELQERPEPEPRPGWVVVQVEAASLCGTDAHQYDGRIDTPFPRVPGHDFSGRVLALGEGVDAAWQDVPVAVKPSLPCGDCPECNADKPFDCSRKKLIGLWSDGCLTERIAVPVVNLIPRPDGVEAWQAALLEPIAVGLNTVDRLRLLLGETVVVLGQGPIGLTELWVGYEPQAYAATRAWSPEAMASASARLRDRDLLDGDRLSDAGRALRSQVEQATDAAMAPVVETLGDRLDGVVARCDVWGAALVERGWFPPDAFKRAAG